MDTALLTIVIGFIVRLFVPFTLLLLLTRFLHRVSAYINGQGAN
jgi:hypothetical protein